MAGLEDTKPWQWHLLRYMLTWPNPFLESLLQIPRTDGTPDPWFAEAWLLAGEWLAEQPHVAAELPAARSMAQWIAWLRAEGFIDEIERPGFRPLMTAPMTLDEYLTKLAVLAEGGLTTIDRKRTEGGGTHKLLFTNLERQRNWWDGYRQAIEVIADFVAKQAHS